MKTTIISTGEELVRGRSLDTNSAFLAVELERIGIEVSRMVTVGDEPGVMYEEMVRALDVSDLVIVTGGLGPTADDRTRDAIARAVDKPLVEDADTLEALRGRLSAFGREVNEHQAVQAHFPEGAVIFPNPQGTARGFGVEFNGAWVVSMPGVPREMVAMFQESVRDFVAEHAGYDGAICSQYLHLYPIAEPDVDERLRDLSDVTANPLVGITVAEGVVTVSLRARGRTREEAQELLDRHVALVRSRFGDVVYGCGGESLAGALAREMALRDVTVGIAESLTGGLIGDMLVREPGISRFFLADVVAYSNDAKEDLLGVPHEVLLAHGAVSEPTARAMAEGACRCCGSRLGISTTGIAGPTGGTPEKPVGLVYVGICLDGETHVVRVNAVGGRDRIRDRTAKYALALARLALIHGVDSLARERRI